MSELPREIPKWALRVRNERSQRGWTRREMAGEMRRVASRLGLGELDGERIKDYVKRWEHGDVNSPDARHQMAIAGAIGLSVRELFGAVAHPVSQLPAAATLGSGEDLPHYESAEDDVNGRRQFMAWLLALSAGATVLPDSVRHTITVINQHPNTLSRITAEDVTNLEATTAMFQGWACKMGGGPSRHAMIGQLGWAVHQLDRGVPASSELRRQWQSASAQLANLTGFNCHDGGHEQQGRGLLALGYRLGAEADDRPMQADALSCMASQAVYLGQPRTGLDLARHGLELADDATPIARAMLHVMKARAYGRMGDVRAMEYEVGLAEQEYARIVPEDREREPWLCFFNEAELYAATGVAWRLLAWHHPDKGGQRAVREAGSRLSLAAEAHGAEFARSRAMCHLMAAGVYLRARDPDAAVAVSKGELLGVRTNGIRSIRVESYARDLKKVARPFQRQPDVQEMIDSLAVAI
ncbi:MAG: helix-turn-helix domain-containing protein [Pseudonocardia sp.]